MQQIKERGALPMIDRGDIRQAIDRCSKTGLHCRALVIRPEHKADSLIAPKKRAERSERLMYDESPRLSPALVIRIIVCLSWAVNHYCITPLPTKPSATKNARELAGERGNY